MSFNLESTRKEISEWFFKTYFNHWVEVGSGKRKEGPEFILQYWGTPLYATVDNPPIAEWMMTGEEIVGFLELQHKLLKEGGYSHTHVPDKKIIVYNDNGGAIEVIWSRRAADQTELQRYVAHFEIIKIDGVWKVVGIQSRNTSIEKDEDSINKAWT
ncbi:DUF6841 family protein [Aquimarina algicola]|uniref:DUF6841 domain-containing protein n=1 Tax=Aquimarina algicola TaxID=2589995 RepID=A0A504J4P5_9FLAO|nr:hypothetical protein [Aquimarina algicola]TPN82868.1 hypothetical protein FHK87_20800 [Aquimarina algicola]